MREEQPLQEHVGTFQEHRMCLTVSAAGLRGLWRDAGGTAHFLKQDVTHGPRKLQFYKAS